MARAFVALQHCGLPFTQKVAAGPFEPTAFTGALAALTGGCAVGKDVNPTAELMFGRFGRVFRLSYKARARHICRQ
jgi:hypothetical protein